MLRAMDGGAIQINSLDRFAFEAANRKGAYRLLDELGRVAGTVTGNLATRLHGSVIDTDDIVVLESRSPEIFGEDAATAAITDGFGNVIGAITKVDTAHAFRERWIVNNPVGEPLAVIEELGRLGALIASWRWPMRRRYAIALPVLDEDGELAPGPVVGAARRSVFARHWQVEVTDDPTERVGRRHVLAAFAVIAIDHTV